MTGWHDLAEELEKWWRLKRAATFWWRDDDAVAASPELDRLLDLSRDLDAPVSLAAIPARLDESLSDLVAKRPNCTMLQHGWSHTNYSDDPYRKAELGAGRPLWDMAADLAEGRMRMMAAFGDRFLPILVPPYNNVDDELLAWLPDLGFRGVSVAGPRPPLRGDEVFRRANIHVDPIDWHGSRGFVGDERALHQIVTHLQDRRLGRADPTEPTGLNTHHLDNDEACWSFIRRLIELSTEHGARWFSADDVFFGTLPPEPVDPRSRDESHDRSRPCNICGNRRFCPGPGGRASVDGGDPYPRCTNCQSLERHRAIRMLYEALPASYLDWRHCLFFAPDPCLDPAMFRQFETSTYQGTNSIDIQDIDRPDGYCDLVVLNQILQIVPDDLAAISELSRILSGNGVMHLTLTETDEFARVKGLHLNDGGSKPLRRIYDDGFGTTVDEETFNVYGNDTFVRFGVRDRGLHVLGPIAIDPVTGSRILVCFLFKSATDCRAWKARWQAAGYEFAELEGT